MRVSTRPLSRTWWMPAQTTGMTISLQLYIMLTTLMDKSGCIAARSRETRLFVSLSQIYQIPWTDHLHIDRGNHLQWPLFSCSRLLSQYGNNWMWCNGHRKYIVVTTLYVEMICTRYLSYQRKWEHLSSCEENKLLTPFLVETKCHKPTMEQTYNHLFSIQKPHTVTVQLFS